MPEYLKRQRLAQKPRIPTRVCLNLTFRCNNVCRQMAISGGEPMSRPHSVEVAESRIRKSATDELNIKGAPIMPEIVELPKRRASTMGLLFGAMSGTCHRVTRQLGGFEMGMRGFRYQLEAEAGCSVRLIFRCDNRYAWQQIRTLAQSLNLSWWTGAPWLFMSTGRAHPSRDAETARHCHNPASVIELGIPDISYGGGGYRRSGGDYHQFAPSTVRRREFHIDSYAGISLYCVMMNPAMRYDLRRGSFQDTWTTHPLAGRRATRSSCGTSRVWSSR